jgi:hypothetical protein
VAVSGGEREELKLPLHLGLHSILYDKIHDTVVSLLHNNASVCCVMTYLSIPSSMFFLKKLFLVEGEEGTAGCG